MKTNPRTVDELVQIYTLSQEGLSQRAIAKELGLSNPSSAAGPLRTLTKYLKGTYRTQGRKSNKYKTAAKLIRQQRLDAKPPTPDNADRFVRLKI